MKISWQAAAAIVVLFLVNMAVQAWVWEWSLVPYFIRSLVVGAAMSAIAIRSDRVRHRKAEKNRERAETRARAYAEFNALIAQTLNPRHTPLLPAAEAPESPSMIPVVDHDEEMLGWKAAYLIFCNGEYFFGPTTSAGGRMYRIEEQAECNLDPYGLWRAYRSMGGEGSPGRHQAPELDCKCGHYAVFAQQQLTGLNRRLALLRVGLSGKVIEHEGGFRAEHQRVLAVHVWPDCYFCRAPAPYLSMDRFDDGGLPVDKRVLVSTCERDVDEGPWVNRSQLAGLLGCEVTTIERS